MNTPARARKVRYFCYDTHPLHRQAESDPNAEVELIGRTADGFALVLLRSGFTYKVKPSQLSRLHPDEQRAEDARAEQE